MECQADVVLDVPIPHGVIMHKNMRLYGKWMYERSDIFDFVKLVEGGMVDLGVLELAGSYGLEQSAECFDKAAESAGFAQGVVMKP